MKNHPLINPETNKEEWISRAMAVLAVVTSFDKNGKTCILAQQRGKGTPDPEFVGAWCLPCGYLDYDETLHQAIHREVFEETGLIINPDQFQMFYVNDDPKEDKRQNVTFRFKVQLPVSCESLKLSKRNSDKDEVENVGWIPLTDIDKLKWAFNHDKIIKDLFQL